MTDVTRYWVLEDELRNAELAIKAAEQLETQLETQPPTIIVEVVLASDHDAILQGLREALGLLTTLVPDMQMDSEHPLEMAGRIVAQVQRLEVQLAAARNELDGLSVLCKEYREERDRLRGLVEALPKMSADKIYLLTYKMRGIGFTADETDALAALLTARQEMT